MQPGTALQAGLAAGFDDPVLEPQAVFRAVMGMTPERYAAVAPLLTIHSGSAGVDPMLAPPAVLSALPGMTPARANAFVEARRGAVELGGLLSGAASSFFTQSTGKLHSIRVVVAAPSGARFVRRALVQLTMQPQRPYRFLEWAEG